MFKNEAKGTAYIIISAMTYGLIGYFGMTIINNGNSASNMLFWRFLLASLIMAVIILPKIKTLGKFSELLKLFVLGGISYFITSITYFISSEYIGSGLAIVIFFTYPIFVAVTNYLLFKTKITKKYLLSIALIFTGIICLVELKNITVDIIGIVLAIVSAVFYAIHVIFTKEAKVAPTVSTFIIVFSSAILSLLYAIIENSFSLPKSDDLLNIGGITLLCTVIPILLMLEGLKHISSLKASILTVFEPVIVFIFGIFLLKEEVTVIQAVGAGIILTGAVITMIDTSFIKRMISRKKPKPNLV